MKDMKNGSYAVRAYILVYISEFVSKYYHLGTNENGKVPKVCPSKMKGESKE